MDRTQHLAWAKQRALEYVDQGKTQEAFASMISDLRKHRELEGHMGIQMGMMLMAKGHLSTPETMRNHIEGYN